MDGGFRNRPLSHEHLTNSFPAICKVLFVSDCPLHRICPKVDRRNRLDNHLPFDFVDAVGHLAYGFNLLFCYEVNLSELYSQRGMDFREEMEKRAADMAFIRDLAARNGIPFELLFKQTNTPPGTVSAASTTPTP